MSCEQRYEADFGDAYNACGGDYECAKPHYEIYLEGWRGCCAKAEKAKFIAARTACREMDVDEATIKECIKEAKATYETVKDWCLSDNNIPG